MSGAATATTVLKVLGFLVDLVKAGVDGLNSDDPDDLKRVTDVFPAGSKSKLEAENIRQRILFERSVDDDRS